MTAQAKALLRKEMRSRLQREKSAIFREGDKLTRHLSRLLKDESSVGLFDSFKDEISTTSLKEWLTRKNIGYVCPVWDAEAMRFSGPTPTVLLIPGLAFDTSGNRLGRGKGHYDKFLAKFSKKPTCIGLCFDSQLVDKVPTDTHDIKMDYVCTPKAGLIDCRKLDK